MFTEKNARHTISYMASMDKKACYTIFIQNFKMVLKNFDPDMWSTLLDDLKGYWSSKKNSILHEKNVY